MESDDVWDQYDKEMEISYNKLVGLDRELTRLNNGVPLPQPKSATQSSYVIDETVYLQTLPDDVDGTFFIALSGTPDGIFSNTEKFKKICPNNKNRTPEEIFNVYKQLLS